MARVAPAHERLDGDDAAQVEVDERLVEELELVALERVPQVLLELEALHHALAHVAVEELEARAAVVLGAVHGDVGVAHDRLGGVAAAVGDRDADRRVDEQGPVVDRDRHRDRVEQPLGDLDRTALAGQALAQHGELVSAHARERVARRDQRLQAPGELGEQLVAALVAERVVDDLEAIDVEHEHGDGAAVARGERERVVDAVDEQDAVRQPGQRVVQRTVLDLLLERDHALERGFEVDAVVHERLAAHAAAVTASGSSWSISAQNAATTTGSNW